MINHKPVLHLYIIGYYKINKEKSNKDVIGHQRKGGTICILFSLQFQQSITIHCFVQILATVASTWVLMVNKIEKSTIWNIYPPRNGKYFPTKPTSRA